MKKRKEKKIRIKSLLLLLLLTAILLITSTYAWFTSNETVTINSLQVNVSTGGGLQISLDGLTWGTIIQAEDILTDGYVGNTNQLPDGLEPMSTDGTVVAGEMNMFYGVMESRADYNSGAFYITATENTDGVAEAEDTERDHYIAFDAFLKYESADTTAVPIYITGTSGISSTSGIKNAGRMAFVVGSTTPSGVTAQSTILNTAKGTSAFIWEPNNDVHVSSGIDNAFQSYGIVITGTTAEVPYCGISDEIVWEDHIPMRIQGVTAGDPATQQTHAQLYSEQFADVTPDLYTTAANTANHQVFTLTPGVTRVRIYMWVEGQDVDCENGVSGTPATFNLAFTLNDE